MGSFGTVEDDATFDEKANGPDLVIAKFQTKGCVICRRVEPALKQLIERTPELNCLINVDAEDNASLAGRFNIRGVPTLILLKDGQELARCNGFQTSAMLRDWIAPFLKC